MTNPVSQEEALKATAIIPKGITREEWNAASHTDRIIYAAGDLEEIILDKAFKKYTEAKGLMASIYVACDAIRAALSGRCLDACPVCPPPTGQKQ